MNDETRPPTTSRRTLLIGAAGLAPLPLASLAQAAEGLAEGEPEAQPAGPYRLPPLPYPYHALEPHIDRRTMQVHHDKHHAGYVNNLNEKVFSQAPDLARMTPEELIRNLDRVPEALRDAARNNGGGHVNHTMFWQLMRPRGGGPPTGPVAEAIQSAFGSFETFRERFNEAGERRFGSGWVWLVRAPGGGLEITTTPYQDNPLMDGKGYPVLGNDVWEHAYYLKYQNRRADYLKAWWNVVNWAEVNRRFVEGGR